MSFQLFTILGLLIMAITLVSLRREHIRTEYSVSWLSVGVILAALSLFPPALINIARRLNVDPNLCLLIIGGTLISALVFEISHVVSKLRDENVLLAQRLAILEHQLHRFGASNAENSIKDGPEASNPSYSGREPSSAR